MFQVSKRAVDIPTRKVVEAFARNYKRLRRNPSEADCFRLATAINIIRRSPEAKTLNAIPGYAKRLVAHRAMSKFAIERLAHIRTIVPESVKLPHVLQLEALVEILDISRDVFLGVDPIAGTRAGAEWHKSARYLAPFAMHALDRVGAESSFEKGGPFVKVMADLLEIAGQGVREPEAISAVLKSGPTLQSWGGSSGTMRWIGSLAEQPTRDSDVSSTKRKKRRKA